VGGEEVRREVKGEKRYVWVVWKVYVRRVVVASFCSAMRRRLVSGGSEGVEGRRWSASSSCRD